MEAAREMEIDSNQGENVKVFATRMIFVSCQKNSVSATPTVNNITSTLRQNAARILCMEAAVEMLTDSVLLRNVSLYAIL